MTGADERSPDDAELTAFVDGELSEARRSEIQRWMRNHQGVRERLALIERGGRPFRAAFDLVLEDTPHARLSAMLSALPTPSPAQKGFQHWRPMLGTAAGFALFGVGLAVGHWVPRGEGARNPPATQAAAQKAPENWRQTVADYFSLQTADALSAAPDDQPTQTRELAVAAAWLGLELSPQRLSFPDLTLKRAELFRLRGMPLSEILYLDSNGGPVALCIIANGNPDATFRAEQREGLNIVYWQSRGRGFLLIGRSPAPELQRRAETIARRLSS